MKYLLAGVLFFSIKISAQTLKSTELCNRTNRSGKFSSESSNVNFFLLKGDDFTYRLINFSDSCKLTKEQLFQLSKSFEEIATKYKMQEIPPRDLKKVSIDNKLWHEVNYYYVDNKTIAFKQVMHVVVIFEGSDVDKEKMNPKVMDIKVLTTDKIKNRKQYL